MQNEIHQTKKHKINLIDMKLSLFSLAFPNGVFCKIISKPFDKIRITLEPKLAGK